jgi:hypothetical protein
MLNEVLVVVYKGGKERRSRKRIARDVVLSIV